MAAAGPFGALLVDTREKTAYYITEATMKKKKWKTPKLEILSRVTPEEFVLTACKQQQSQTALDPGTLVQMCGSDVGGSCAACQARGQS